MILGTVSVWKPVGVLIGLSLNLLDELRNVDILAVVSLE